MEIGVGLHGVPCDKLGQAELYRLQSYPQLKIGLSVAMDRPLFHQILQDLPGNHGQSLDVQPVSGGDINQAYRLETSAGFIFIKLNQACRLDMFKQEALGLKALSTSQVIRTPQILGAGVVSNYCYLALSWHHPIQAERQHWHQLGEQLAALHQQGAGNEFGWPTNNYIGSTPQLNQAHGNWAEFFARQRLEPQLNWLNAPLPAPIEVISQVVTERLAGYHPKPSLLHGDLWAGNVMFDKEGPLLIDPACYIGDAETDLAFSRLFGGFPPTFYQAYRSNTPDSKEHYHELYNLYHLLNHANLFGGHYVVQSLHLLQHYI